VDFALIVLVLAGTLPALAAVTFVCVYSTPAQYRRRTEALEDKLEKVIAAFGILESTWIRYRTDLQSLEESIENALQTVEKKRRQTAAAASRAGGDGAEHPLDPSQLSGEDARNFWRAQTYGRRAS